MQFQVLWSYGSLHVEAMSLHVEAMSWIGIRNIATSSYMGSTEGVLCGGRRHLVLSLRLLAGFSPMWVSAVQPSAPTKRALNGQPR